MKRLLEIVIGTTLIGIGAYNIPPENLVSGILAFVLIPTGLAIIFGRVISGGKKKESKQEEGEEESVKR